MPNPITNFRDSFATDLGNKLITKEYLMSVYPQIANQLITPELWIWGYASQGQLGGNDTTWKSTPVTTFSGGANWKQVDGGGSHTAAIKTDGTLWMWGNGGRLGDNAAIQKNTPLTTFAGGTNWKQVSCGGYQTAAIKTDGTLWTWGVNSSAQLGDNTTTNRNTPVTTFAGGTNWKQVSCGGYNTAAIKTDGTLWTWGRNVEGNIGDNTVTQRNTPVTTFAGGTNWKQVSVGRYHIAAIKTDGTLWGWGDNAYGSLGINSALHPVRTPVTTFAGGTNWKQVVCKNRNTLAIKTDGTLWVWGWGNGAKLGVNDGANRISPVTTFAGGTNWKQVSGGVNYTAAIKTDGTLWTWGQNGYGQLGINATTARSTPITTFVGGTNWKQVFLGSGHTVAIKTSDDLQGI